MSALLKSQQEFAQAAALIIRMAYVQGYEVTLGHAMRCQDCPTGHPRSLHKSKLAIDLNLFDRRTGEYITDHRGHRDLHVVWEKMGGSAMIENDPNHYSFPMGNML